MRRFLFLLSLLFIASSSFAKDQEGKEAAYRTVLKKKTSLLNNLYSKAGTDDSSSISQDYFEHPTLIRQIIRKTGIASIQLFQRQETAQQLAATVKIYIADPRSDYKFIYQCLYPKHVFW